MVWESKYWKEPLLDLASKIDLWEKSTDLKEAELADIEREVMIGFYSIRKLAQSNKLSDKTLDESLKVSTYPNTKKITLINRFHIDQTFDLKAKKIETLNIKYIYNQIIHSYIFLLEESNDRGLSGIFFNSDYKRNEKLYFLETTEIKRIFRKVGNDYPAKSKMIYNEEKEDYDISNR